MINKFRNCHKFKLCFPLSQNVNEPCPSNAATLACNVSLSSHFVSKASTEILSTATCNKKKLHIWIWCEEKELVSAFSTKQGSMIHSEPETNFGERIAYCQHSHLLLYELWIPIYFLFFFFPGYVSHRVMALHFCLYFSFFFLNHWMKMSNKCTACSYWRDFFLLTTCVLVSCLCPWNVVPS